MSDHEQKEPNEKPLSNPKPYPYYNYPAPAHRVEPTNPFYPQQSAENIQPDHKNNKYYQDYYSMYGYGGYPSSYMMPPNYLGENKYPNTSASAANPNIPVAPNMYPMMNSGSQNYPFSYPYYGGYPGMNPHYGMYNPYMYGQMEGMHQDSHATPQDYRTPSLTAQIAKTNPFTQTPDIKYSKIFKNPPGANPKNTPNTHIQQLPQVSLPNEYTKQTEIIILSDSQEDIKKKIIQKPYKIKKVAPHQSNEYKENQGKQGQSNSARHDENILIQQQNHDPFYIKKKRIAKEYTKQRKKELKLRQQAEKMNSISRRLAEVNGEKSNQMLTIKEGANVNNEQKSKSQIQILEQFYKNYTQQHNQLTSKPAYNTNKLFKEIRDLNDTIQMRSLKKEMKKSKASKQLKNLVNKGEQEQIFAQKMKKANEMIDENLSNEQLSKLMNSRINRFNNRSTKKPITEEPNKSKQFLQNQIHKFNAEQPNNKFNAEQTNNKFNAEQPNNKFKTNEINHRKRYQTQKRSLQKQKGIQIIKVNEGKAQTKKQDKQEEKKDKQDKKQGEKVISAEQKQQIKKQKMKDNHPLEQLRFSQSHGKIRIGCYFQASLPNLMKDDHILMLGKQLRSQLNQRLISAITF